MKHLTQAEYNELVAARDERDRLKATYEPVRDGTTRVYIAGPMSGLPQLNFPAFNAAAEALRARGFIAINPAEVNPDTSMPWADCLRRDIPHLLTCDTIAMLPNWELSRGTTLEHHIAKALGMRVAFMSELVGEAACAS